MRTLLFFGLIIIFASCKNSDENKIVKNISKYYEIDKPDTTGLGVLFYTFNCSNYDTQSEKFVYDDPFIMEPKIKGAVDQAMEALPVETNEKTMLKVYEWENLQTKVLMESHFKTAYDTPVVYLQVKLWITNKKNN